MAWVYIDDQFPDHPKVAAAGEAAAYLYVCGLAYCKRYGTEGQIPKAQVAKLVTAKASALTHRLLAVGLWEDSGTDYAVHDYAEWNKPQESRSAAGRKAAKARWDRVADADADAMRTHSESHTNGDASECPSSPPFPSGETFSSSSPPSSDSSDDERVQSILRLFAERQTAKHADRNPAGFRQKVLQNARTDYAELVADWLTRYDVSDGQIADALVGGACVPASWGMSRRETA